MNFKGPQEGSDYLYKEYKINKLKNIIIIANCQFVYDQLKNYLPQRNFSNFFSLDTQLHQHNTRKNILAVPNANMMTSYRSYSISLKAIKQWYEVQKFIATDIYSPQMMYPRFLKSVLQYIKSQ